MDFRIADTFTDGLARLNGAEQKAVKTTAFDLQLNSSSPGLRFHRLDRARDPNFWSVRVNDDIRLIVHRTASSLLLCHVGHHDPAYAWAARRRIERHPTTGAAQLVELPERVEHGPRPTAVPAKPAPKRLLFARVADEKLLAYGVPSEWLEEVRRATEDSLFEIIDHLPQEAGEALLNLATGTTPEIPAPVPLEADPFSHPNAQRRFRVLSNVEELERALDYPLPKWHVDLAKIYPIKRATNRSWINLRRGCLDQMGVNVSHGTRNVRASSRAFAKKAHEATGLEYAAIIGLLDRHSLGLDDP
jgi:hypothetical protein